MNNICSCSPSLGLVEIGVPEICVSADTLWVNQSQAQMKEYVETVIKPYVEAYIEEQLQSVRILPPATEATPGIVRLATAEEAFQGIDNDVALTPQKARAGFVDKEGFEQFKSEATGKLAEKTTIEEQEALEAFIGELNEKIGGVGLILDNING